MDEEKVLWRDRKRYLGLPISFTRYELTDERITVKTGLFTTTTEDVMLYRVLDTSLKRSFGQKIFGVGSIHLHTADRTAPELHLINIKQSERVRKLLSQLVEDERLKRRVGAREMYTGNAYFDDDMDGDPFN